MSVPPGIPVHWTVWFEEVGRSLAGERVATGVGTWRMMLTPWPEPSTSSQYLNDTVTVKGPLPPGVPPPPPVVVVSIVSAGFLTSVFMVVVCGAVTPALVVSDHVTSTMTALYGAFGSSVSTAELMVYVLPPTGVSVVVNQLGPIVAELRLVAVICL